MKSIITSIALGALLAASASSCHKTAVADSDDWQLVWEENFDSTAIDTSTWVRIPRGTANWNDCMTTADTCYELRDGNLILHGIRAYEGNNDSVPYLTGGVYTRGKKSFGNGRLEIRAKLGAARGAWPAIWLLPDPAYQASQWPDGGEIDIMERLNYDTIAYQTVHSRYTLELKLDTIPPHYATGAINPDDYNVYAVEMYPDSLSFYINDTHTFTYPRIETDKPWQFPYADAPFYLLIDMQLGGDWVGEVDPADLPVEMAVDWVRFYQKPGSSVSEQVGKN